MAEGTAGKADEKERSESLPASPARANGPSLPRPPASGRRRALSIHQKLLALIALLIVGVVGSLAVYLPHRQIAAMQAALEAKSSTYARLASVQLQPAVAFNDRQTAREVFESMAQDEDVESLTLFSSSGEVIVGHGALHGEVSSRAQSLKDMALVRDSERILVLSPVVALEGPRGVLALELSTRRLVAQGAVVRRDAALAGLVALLLGIAGASVVAVSLGRRLRAIARVAESVAEGNLDQAALVTEGPLDEIGSVALAFNTMLAEIRGLVGRIRTSAQEEQERLEALVSARTAELRTRHADLKRLLDNVEQGFFTLDLDGRMSRERSAIVETWFGAVPESAVFAEVLSQFSPRCAESFAIGWEEMREGILTVELYLDQLPKGATVNGRELELGYRPIVDGAGSLERVLVVVSDVTARVERERAEADEREMTQLFSRALADRRGFRAFMRETAAQVDCIAHHAAADRTELKRALHTLKGNTALYGICTISAMCHALEDAMSENGTLHDEAVAKLEQRWLALSSKMKPLLDLGGDTLEVTQTDYAELLGAVERSRPCAELQALMLAWRLERTETRLRGIAEQAVALGGRLNKAVEVRIESNLVRLGAERWSEFWAASAHVVRNAVDHGIEPVGERAAKGKPVPAVLTFRTLLTADHLTIEFSDTGRGIDWAAVARQACSLGLPTDTREALTEALFTDGVSTRTGINEISGRGVGLGAAREACRKLGGRVEVASTPGEGATFRFIWPATVVAATSTPAPARWERAS
jgi:two-component system chemotaxis sensor kinase CheA